VIIANAENAASGYGLTKKIANEFFDQGIDALTLGNHAWDQKEMLSYIEECPKIIRPINFPSGVPGRGEYKIELEDGRSLLVIQAMLRLFMDSTLDDPFATVLKRLSSEFLGNTCNSILIDMHGEATSEKNAFAHYFDGKVTAILGTHTHIPTADERILDNKTAYQTDIGMTGDYNSVIGMDKKSPIHGFTKGYRLERFTTATGNGKICGTYLESDDKTGLAENIESFLF
jgi:metallophosphoesterase (TIGR00282 family)